MLKKSLLLMLLMALMAPWVANAQETLTVYDGTKTNYYVPAYVYYFDEFTRSQHVIPAEDIAEMAGGTINSIKYYTTSENIPYTSVSTVDVYLMEVGYTTMTALEPKTYDAIVYQGTLDFVAEGDGGSLTITLSKPYTYEGGNLLVGIENTTDAGWKSIYFYGTNVTYNAAWAGYSSSSLASVTGSGKKFIPKTTFTYEAAAGGCDMPTAIAVNDITHNSATVTWEGDGNSWNLRYKAPTDADYTLVEGLTTKTYTFNGSLESNTTYSVGVQTVCTGATSNFKSTSFTTKNPCAAPTDLTISNVTATSATLNWKAGYQETSWTVKYKKSAEAWDDAKEETVSGTPTLTLTGLDGLTTYNVQVYNCENYVSGSFTTAASFPYAQDFSGSGIPTGWTQWTGLLADVMTGTALTSTSYGWSNGTGNGVLDGNHIYSNIYGSSCKKWIVTPAVPMPAGARITFDVAYTDYNGTAANPAQNGEDDKFVVLASTDKMATWTILRQWDNAGSEYVLNDLTPTTLSLNFDMAEYAGTSLQIAFYAESTVSNADNNIHVDNVVFELVPSCEKPTNLTVNYTGGTTATVSFNSDAEAWNLDVNGTVTPITTNPYTIEGLELATTYNVKVQANCGGTTSEWSNTQSFATDMCLPENQCQLTFILKDNYGDGWNGNAINVVDVETNVVLATMAADDHGGGGVASTDTKYLSVCDGREIKFTWVKGSYPGEASWEIYDINEELITSGTGTTSMNTGDVLATYMVNCTVTTCKKPTDLAADPIFGRSAVLSWTENGEATEWIVAYASKKGDEFGEYEEVATSTNPYTLEPLEPETDYQVKVRPVCEPGVEKWSDAITFTTDVACPAPTNVAVSDVEPFNATVSWVGTSDSYNLRYRTARGFLYDFETAEAWVVDEFPPCTTYDGDGRPTYGIDGYSMPNANYVGSVIAFSDNDQWAAHSGNTMGAFMDAIPDGDVTANDDYFITPELTIAAGDHFMFWARSVTASYGLERIKVGVYGGSGTISEYFAGSATEYVEVPVEWTKYNYDLTAYVGQTIQLAINCVSADAFALLFDDIFVGNPNDDSWDHTVNNATSPYTITGLTEETMYEVQVQAACGEDGTSVWVDGGSFTTPSNCAAPTGLAETDITINSAILSWEGFHASYNLQYRTAASRETYYFNDFNDQIITGWDYSGSFVYGFTDPIYNIPGDENYFLAMGWDSTEEETIVSCELPEYGSGAIVEFYYFGYNTANTFQVGYSSTTNEADAFTWSEPIDAPLRTYTRYQQELTAGTKYVAWKATASEQGACIFIDDFGIFGADIPAGEWQTLNAVTSPYALTGLYDYTEYEWQVQGINTACSGGVTEWSNMSSFTTPYACEVPEIDDVTVVATTATVEWTGIQESYNLRYSTFVLDALYDFNDGVIPSVFTNDETYPWAVTDTLTDAGYCIRSTNQGVASSTSTISYTATFATSGVISFDAMFRGEGSATVYDKCIFSIDGNQQFAYGAIGAVWYNMASAFTAGTHTFTWSYTKDSSVNPTGDFFAVNNIKFDLRNDTWTTVEKITGNTYDITDLTPNSVISVQVQGINASCDGGVTEWSNEYLFMTPKPETITQTIDLIAGWNWVSIGIAVDDPVDMLDMLKASLGDNASEIQSVDYTTEFDGEEWFGDLDDEGVFNEQMYLIEATNDCTVELTGMPAVADEYEITIYPGWNWIGFPSAVAIDVADALFDFDAAEGDEIQSLDYTTEFDGDEWFGDLETLEPGQGLLYNNTTDETKILIFGTGAKKVRNAKPVLETFKVVPVKAKVMGPCKSIADPINKDQAKKH